MLTVWNQSKRWKQERMKLKGKEQWTVVIWKEGTWKESWNEGRSMEHERNE